jgi:hypothetical protein
MRGDRPASRQAEMHPWFPRATLVRREVRAVSSKQRKWKGALATPIRQPHVIRPRGYRVDSNTVEAENTMMCQAMDEAVEKARLEKLDLLFEHYGIENKLDYFNLSLALAVEHVPGFAVKHVNYKLSHGNCGAVEPVEKTGRPREWTSERSIGLFRAVKKIKSKQGIKEDREALRLLSRHQPWKPPANHRGGPDKWVETLETRLQEVKAIRKKAAQQLHNILNLKRKRASGSSGKPSSI